jgi:membrane-associated protease RseP (regulator of RpoE activity)
MILAGVGCGAVYPEMKTPVRAPAAGTSADPPPPADFYFITFAGAHVPPKTRDGRDWVPNPFAKLLVEGKEILVTPTESANNWPRWQDQKHANYRIGDDDTVTIEVWDDGTVGDQPICMATVRDLHRIVEGGSNQIDCDSGARVWLNVEPAHAMLGVGFYYELGGQGGVQVTRVLGQSPAERAGIVPGDRIVAVQDEPVKGMDPLQVRSTVNSHVREGLNLDLLGKDGKKRRVSVKEGPIYPLDGDDLALPNP